MWKNLWPLDIDFFFGFLMGTRETLGLSVICGDDQDMRGERADIPIKYNGGFSAFNNSVSF